MNGSLLFPAKCIFCGQVMNEDKLICAECMADEVMIVGKICAFCGVSKENCTCGKRKKHFERRIACAYYRDAVCRGMARFKFYRHTMLGEYYGMLMAQNIQSKYADIPFDGLVAVPMHPIHRFKRGYNCAEILAERISEHIGVPLYYDVMGRKLGKAQKKVHKWSERAVNVLDKFYIKNKDMIQDKTLLLIDDVCTSGATLNECAKMLRLYGAKKVYAATFAAVVKST